MSDQYSADRGPTPRDEAAAYAALWSCGPRLCTVQDCLHYANPDPLPGQPVGVCGVHGPVRS